jgi:hypothetical protein
MLQIDKQFPIPVRTPPRVPDAIRTPIYPFPTMDVGDSFAMPVALKDRLYSVASQWKARHPGWGYRTMIMDDVIRLWRVA